MRQFERSLLDCRGTRVGRVLGQHGITLEPPEENAACVAKWLATLKNDNRRRSRRRRLLGMTMARSRRGQSRTCARMPGADARSTQHL